MIHVTDWFATLVGLAGGDTPADTDGYDQWEAIATSALSPRNEMIYNIDLTKDERAGIRVGDYKLLVGNPGPGEWTPPPEGKPGIPGIMNPLEIHLQESHKNISDSLDVFLERLQNITHDRRQNEINISMESNGNLSNPVGDASLWSLEDQPFYRRQNELGSFINISTSSSSSIISEDTWTDSWNDEDLVTVGDLNLNLNLYPSLRPILHNDTEIRLFNITGDPEERDNIAAKKADVVYILLGILQYSMKDYVEADTPPNDPAANPKHWNNTWTPGWCRAK